MSNVIGKITDLDGTFYVKSVDGSLKEIVNGDEIYEGVTVVGGKDNTLTDSVTVSMKDGADVSVSGTDQQLFDSSLSKEVSSMDEAVQQQDTLASLLQENGDITDAGDEIETAAGAEGGPESTDGGPARFAVWNGLEQDINADLRDRAFSDTIPTNDQEVREETIPLVATQTTEPEPPIPPISDILTDADESVSDVEDATQTGSVFENGPTDTNGLPLSVTAFSVDGQSGVVGLATTIENVGDLTINADGSYTFVPVANYSGTVPTATYTVSNGSETDTSTLSIEVTPIADAPTLSVVVGEAVVEFIHFNAYAYEGNGFHSGNDNSAQATVSYVDGLGYGVSNKNGDHGNQTTAIENNETLTISLDSDAVSATFKVNMVGGFAPIGAWIVYNELGERVSSETNFTLNSSGEVTVSATDNVAFKYVVFEGKATGNDANKHEFYIEPVSASDGIITINLTQSTFEYAININAALTDTDGSESLGNVMIPVNSLNGGTLSGDNVVLNGDVYEVDVTANNTDTNGSATVTLTTSEMLSDDELNDITASVTSTETNDDGNSFTTTTTAQIEILGTENADNISGTDANEYIDAGDGDDIILFDSQDTVDGGEGFDTLSVTDAAIDFTVLSNNIDNIEAIDLGQGAQTIQSISLSDVLQVTDSSNILRIEGDSSDRVALNTTGTGDDGEWTLGQTITDASTGHEYQTYSGNIDGFDVTLEIHTDIIVDES